MSKEMGKEQDGLSVQETGDILHTERPQEDAPVLSAEEVQLRSRRPPVDPYWEPPYFMD